MDRIFLNVPASQPVTCFSIVCAAMTAYGEIEPKGTGGRERQLLREAAIRHKVPARAEVARSGHSRPRDLARIKIHDATTAVLGFV